MAAIQTSVVTEVPREIDAVEWDLRVQLAACYRIVDYFGWCELIYGHISLRVPGPEHHFLINPYGLRYDEMTASSLVKIDLDGNLVEPSQYPFNPAGFVIHSAIHQHRENAHCVIHTHTRAGMAVAALECGLLNISMNATSFYNNIGYHDYEGSQLVSGGAQEAGPRPGHGKRHDPAQPWPAERWRDRPRGVPAHLPFGAGLPGPARRHGLPAETGDPVRFGRPAVGGSDG